MTTGAMLFMAVAWTVVLSVTGWVFFRILFPKARGEQAGAAGREPQAMPRGSAEGS